MTYIRVTVDEPTYDQLIRQQAKQMMKGIKKKPLADLLLEFAKKGMQAGEPNNQNNQENQFQTVYSPSPEITEETHLSGNNEQNDSFNHGYTIYTGTTDISAGTDNKEIPVVAINHETETPELKLNNMNQEKQENQQNYNVQDNEFVYPDLKTQKERIIYLLSEKGMTAEMFEVDMELEPGMFIEELENEFPVFTSCLLVRIGSYYNDWLNIRWLISGHGTPIKPIQRTLPILPAFRQVG